MTSMLLSPSVQQSMFADGLIPTYQNASVSLAPPQSNPLPTFSPEVSYAGFGLFCFKCECHFHRL